jgi:hypothetical protein
MLPGWLGTGTIGTDHVDSNRKQEKGKTRTSNQIPTMQTQKYIILIELVGVMEQIKWTYTQLRLENYELSWRMI